ncbi:MAG: hypothetical protein AAF514_15390, partial [Verrucomicrobiota bacterium]
LACLAFLGGAFFVVARHKTTPQPRRVVYYYTWGLYQQRGRGKKEEVRTLLFVDADGQERPQSSIDLKAPHELRLAYTRSLFSTLLLRPKHDRILVVGLGGGGMVRFANHALTGTHVDAVEIDPAVVEVAEKFFGTASGPRTSIFTEDAFDFIGRAQEPYDVIYMDAFLRPPKDSRLGELPARLRTSSFLRQLAGHLKPGGLVAFNLVRTDLSTAADLAVITESFPTVYQFTVAGTGNLVVIGADATKKLSRAQIEAAALRLEAGKIDLPFVEMAGALIEGPS